MIIASFLLFHFAVLGPAFSALPVTARECPANWEAKPGMKASANKPANKEKESSGSCVELAFSPLEIQEYLQSYARGQNWKIVEEHLTEDSWTFSLALSKDEVLADTRGASRPNRVEWRSGIALVQISSTQVGDNFTRSIVRARFRGYGDSADQFAPQKEYWDLESNGSLEAKIASILKSRFEGQTASH